LYHDIATYHRDYVASMLHERNWSPSLIQAFQIKADLAKRLPGWTAPEDPRPWIPPLSPELAEDYERLRSLIVDDRVVRHHHRTLAAAYWYIDCSVLMVRHGEWSRALVCENGAHATLETLWKTLKIEEQQWRGSRVHPPVSRSFLTPRGRFGKSSTDSASPNTASAVLKKPLVKGGGKAAHPSSKPRLQRAKPSLMPTKLMKKTIHASAKSTKPLRDQDSQIARVPALGSSATKASRSPTAATVPVPSAATVPVPSAATVPVPSAATVPMASATQAVASSAVSSSSASKSIAEGSDAVPATGVVMGSVPATPAEISFAPDSSSLSPESVSLLTDFVEQAKKVTPSLNALHWLIQGFSDDADAGVESLALSQKRAESVRQWLIGQGVAATSIEVFAYESLGRTAVGKATINLSKP
jgi:outer membrane protein OmpA-like peptidoglycan-associated protein